MPSSPNARGHCSDPDLDAVEAMRRGQRRAEHHGRQFERRGQTDGRICVAPPCL